MKRDSVLRKSAMAIAIAAPVLAATPLIHEAMRDHLKSPYRNPAPVALRLVQQMGEDAERVRRQVAVLETAEGNRRGDKERWDGIRERVNQVHSNWVRLQTMRDRMPAWQIEVADRLGEDILALLQSARAAGSERDDALYRTHLATLSERSTEIWQLAEDAQWYVDEYGTYAGVTGSPMDAETVAELACDH